MLHDDPDAVRARAEHLAAAVGGDVEQTVSRVGGGALPLAELPSFACAIEEELATPLRVGDPPVVGSSATGGCYSTAAPSPRTISKRSSRRCAHTARLRRHLADDDRCTRRVVDDGGFEVERLGGRMIEARCR